MTDLVVDQLTVSVPDLSDLPRRVPTMLQRLAAGRLEDALRAADLPPGEWFLRRLDVRLTVDPERPDASIEESWARAVVATLERELAAGGADVAGYARRTDGLVDLVAGCALGTTSRAWAWRRLGLLGPGDPDPDVAPAEAALAALARVPRDAVPVLVAVAGRVGVAALHRLLRSAGWARLAWLAAPDVAPEGWRPDPRRAPGAQPGASGHRPPARPGPQGAATDDSLLGSGAGAAALAAELVARSVLATSLRRSQLRVDEATAHAWAVLVAAEADPASLRRPSAPALVAALAAHLTAGSLRAGRAVTAAPAASPPAPGRPAPRTAVAGADRGTDRVHEAGRGAPARDSHALPTPAHADLPVHPDVPARPDLPAHPDPPPDLRTQWAGLLFLLNTAADASVPDRVLDDPALAARSLRWSLHRIGRHLVPVAPADPALLAFCALPAAPVDLVPTAAGEEEALRAHATRWAVATADRLGRTDTDPFAVVAEVAARAGTVTVEPGWCEVWMAADEVDIEVRRAGLDLDPGWVGWLGTVVRFGYA